MRALNTSACFVRNIRVTTPPQDGVGAGASVVENEAVKVEKFDLAKAQRTRGFTLRWGLFGLFDLQIDHFPPPVSFSSSHVPLRASRSRSRRRTQFRTMCAMSPNSIGARSCTSSNNGVDSRGRWPQNRCELFGLCVQPPTLRTHLHARGVLTAPRRRRGPPRSRAGGGV